MGDQFTVLEALAHPSMPAQEALCILRLSCVHKLDFLARCVRPRWIEPVVQR